MALTVNVDLWREAKEKALRDGRDLFGLLGTPRTVLNLFVLTRAGRSGFKNVSRLWIERHGERAAGVISAVLNRPIRLEELFPRWDRSEERPLARRESEQLRRAFEGRSQALNPREVWILRRTFGLDGQPRSLASVAKEMGVSRERVRQIEAAALEKLGVNLPGGRHKSLVARRRRARLFLRTLNGAKPDHQLRIDLFRTRDGLAAHEMRSGSSFADEFRAVSEP